VSATLSFHFSNIDIPAGSVGVAQTYFGPDGLPLEIKALKRNLVQLTSAAIERGVSVDEHRLRSLLDTEYETEDFKVNLKSFAEKIKKELYSIKDSHVPNIVS
jgi:hypothetical protein